jgi:hypothetical protein
MTNYTIKNDDNYGEILFIDGKESMCPFRSPVAIPSQNSLGQMTMQLITLPCCTRCPHATVEKFGLQDHTTYTMTCNGTTIELELQ